MNELAEVPPENYPRLPCRNFPEYYFIVLRFLPPLRNTFDFPKILIFDLQPQRIKVPRVKKSFRSQCRTTISLTPKLALGANLAHFFKHFEKRKNGTSDPNDMHIKMTVMTWSNMFTHKIRKLIKKII